jgi:carbon storage regulator
MLVLTRKHQEKIRIGDNITITVLKTKGKAVRLGIEAPADIQVIRGELAVQQPAELATPADGMPGTATVRPTRLRRTEIMSAAAAGWTPGATDSRASTQVSFRRVPRDEVGKLLPRAAASRGPLRAIMEQR